MEIAPGIYGLSQKQGGWVHAYLIDDGQDLSLVDTLFSSDGQKILELLSSLGKRPSDIKRIILTHAHRAHLGGLARLKELTGAQVYAHEWEADLIARERPMQTVSWRPQPSFRTYPYQIAHNLNISRAAPVHVDEYLHEGDRVGPLCVSFAPGHSPGHLAFYWPERRALIAGDAVATWPFFQLGWPAFTLNPTHHARSLRKLAEFDAEIVCVGHGDPIRTGGAARIRAALPA